MRSAELDREMRAFETNHWLPDEQCLSKTRSRRCREAFDLHIYSVSGWLPEENAWKYNIFVSVVNPQSVGTVRLASTDPEAAPILDHGFLSDPDGYDLAVIADGVEIAHEMLAASPLAKKLGPDERLGAAAYSRAAIEQFVKRTVGIYWHPACSCRMGPANDESTVVDASGKIHGLDNLYICDASIFPVIMRANTNLPAAMLAEQMAKGMATF
jgi:choline dehydrogenase